MDEDTFEAAQQILIARGDDHAARAANASDYLLAGLIVCALCGKRYVGGVATGRSRRYRYYSCFSRNRYGTSTCPAERLPADALDTAVLESILATYISSGPSSRPSQHRRPRSTPARPPRGGTHRHHGRPDQDRPSRRPLPRRLRSRHPHRQPVRASHRRAQREADQLRARRHQLTDALDASTKTEVTTAELHHIRDRITQAITNGQTTARKALLQALVAQVTVHSRDDIRPTYRIPSTQQRPTSSRFTSWTDRWAILGSNQ